MSNNYDKIVKLACKPKNAPPKSKYVDVLVSATYSDDGSLNDVIRSLSIRIREPNAVVVFKALLTLHQMLRSGSTDQLLEFLAQGDMLRLRNVGGQNWEGYAPPSNMGAYAQYIDSRIRSWRDLKHDLVTVQTESNRRSNGLGAGSKARRLRHLPVEKGLLREVAQVQKILDTLVQCKFYDDDLRDENTVLAFRMIVKDLLVLFQAGNEGVCNILEHYFEMSKPDASESFAIYKSFIKQTDRVVDYLGVARKLHNVVNVPVPNLKHAPTGLVKALEEYLNDPNFEENRREYKASLGVVEGKAPAVRMPSPNPASVKETTKPAASTSSAPALTSSTLTAPAAPPGASQKIQDFFDSIQSDHQPTMFGGPAQHLPQQAQMQMQAPFNPFRQSMMMPQQTGFMQSQTTGFGMPGGQQQQQVSPMPFMQPQATGAMAFGQAQNFFPQQGQNLQPFQQQGLQSLPQSQFQNGFLSNQQTGFMQPQGGGGLQPLQPQGTGSNPFRQSMMVLNTNVNPSGAMSQPSSPFGQNHAQIQRPGSTPAISSILEPKPLTAQVTGSKNPFAPAPGSVPPVPKVQEQKGPSMNELAWNKQQGQFGGGAFGQQRADQGFNPNASTNATSSPWGSVSGKPTTGMGMGDGSGSVMSDLATSFTFDSKISPSTSNSTNDFFSQFKSMSVGPTHTGSTSPPPSQFNSLSSSKGNNTGMAPSPTGTSSSGGFIQPQPSGYGGSNVKRFQPTSSFGSQLMVDLPPIHEPGSTGTGSAAASPSTAVGGVNPQQTGFPGMIGMGGSGGFGQGQGQAQGQGQGQNSLSVQQTGMANPFTQSMMFGGAPQGGQDGQGQGPQGGGVSTSGPFGRGSPFVGQNNPSAGGSGDGPAPFGQQAFGQQPFGQQPTPFGQHAFGQGAFGQQGQQNGPPQMTATGGGGS